MKKILVTGANGLLGQKIIAGYKSNPEVQLIATARGECRILDQSGFIYESMNISDKAEVLAVVEKHNPDVIINTAAMTNVDQCETDKAGCDEANVTAVKILASVCEKNDIHLVHLSTDFIFDGKDGPYDEEAKANPLSYYGWSKFKAEEIIKTCECKWSILRTVLVIGITEGMSRSNIVLWAKGALGKGQEINVVDDQFRTPTLAEDLADGCMLVAMQGAEGVYNISGKDFMSILELVEKVADFYKLDKTLIKRSSSETLNQPAKRPPVTGFILDKAINNLGYAPHSFEESLAIMQKQIDYYESIN
ncbi:MAG: SDR family oxidoreductase [Schleiferiaceae bacterium]|jgi:dTDP-4-dehydrorhamnose reductase|nr:SDR family oxidoreductase [Schleiferiaceae bacterium]